MLKRLLAWLRGKPPVFVSWYCGPRLHDEREYLRAYPAGSCCQESWGPGYEYVPNLADATRFVTYEEAYAVTPRYDGSGGIENRAGVLRVH